MSLIDQSNGAQPSKPRARAAQPLDAVQVDQALLRLSTVEAILGLGKTTIYAKAATGELTPIRIGKRCTRWRASDVQRFLQAQGKGAA